MHSTESVLGMVGQLSMMPCFSGKLELWLHTVIPPVIVSVVVAAMCYPLADGKVLALNPYCKIEDLDLEMMHYKPNGWALVPQFVNVLLESSRIPDDYVTKRADDSVSRAAGLRVVLRKRNSNKKGVSVPAVLRPCRDYRLLTV